jgi:hypothetical protein
MKSCTRRGYYADLPVVFIGLVTWAALVGCPASCWCRKSLQWPGGMNGRSRLLSPNHLKGAHSTEPSLPLTASPCTTRPLLWQSGPPFDLQTPTSCIPNSSPIIIIAAKISWPIWPCWRRGQHPNAAGQGETRRHPGADMGRWQKDNRRVINARLYANTAWAVRILRGLKPGDGLKWWHRTVSLL